MMELGLTWPLQRLLKLSVPYGMETERGFCWDAHCITLRGESALLLVHCASRFTLVRFAMTPFDWQNLDGIAREEIALGLAEAGIGRSEREVYLQKLGMPLFTRTHGRREVAFLNRAWEDVLVSDLLVDTENCRQPLLNAAVNATLCRCAGEDVLCSAQAHLEHWFACKKGEGAL